MVELDILYLALFPFKEGNLLNTDFLERTPSKLLQILPNANQWNDVVRVIDIADLAPKKKLQLYANTLQQHVLCYFE
jgi:hypothetical protein